MASGSNTRVLLCLLLGCAALPAAARQPAMMDANGAGAGCPVSAEADTELEPVRTDKRAVAPTRARPAPARRGGETDAATRAPRWHSFLPGMIR
ncbi:hypothetical protein [Luteimonas kalidii]|uniref:Uncharacterized protein n=1 Tax=Luteimonas kalidii TaxID=3042025 RepID=A0ABT6JXF3_9GAMM|nr:hypothetical protein [Luteimonas kalidii]MDH5835372.1 hypothetical protein [Luteimonas kalidii]